MGFVYLLLGLVAAAVTVFALQNGTPATIRFLTWTLDSVPIAGLILVPFAAGLVLAALALVIQHWRTRSRVRRLEARVKDLEATLAQRDKAPLTPPRAAP
jgi:uncharacterized integral membrane protein